MILKQIWGTVTKLYVKGDNNAAGFKTIQNKVLARTHNALPIIRLEVSFALLKNTYIYNQAN